jgi:hypothetical protein
MHIFFFHCAKYPALFRVNENSKKLRTKLLSLNSMLVVQDLCIHLLMHVSFSLYVYCFMVYFWDAFVVTIIVMHCIFLGSLPSTLSQLIFIAAFIYISVDGR